MQPLRYHGDGNRLEPHLVAISLSVLCKERKKEIYGEGGGEGEGWSEEEGANIFCNAKQKESRVELLLREFEIINSAADSVKSAFLVAVQLQDKWIRLQSIAVELQ